MIHEVPNSEDHPENNLTDNDAIADGDLDNELRALVKNAEMQPVKDRVKYITQAASIIFEHPNLYDSEEKIEVAIRKVSNDDSEIMLMQEMIRRWKSRAKSTSDLED